MRSAGDFQDVLFGKRGISFKFPEVTQRIEFPGDCVMEEIFGRDARRSSVPLEGHQLAEIPGDLRDPIV